MIDWSSVITTEHKKKQREMTLLAQRDRAIADTDWLVMRHRDELDMGKQTTITEAEYSRLLEHRQALRDWPCVAGWADTPIPQLIATK